MKMDLNDLSILYSLVNWARIVIFSSLFSSSVSIIFPGFSSVLSVLFVKFQLVFLSFCLLKKKKKFLLVWSFMSLHLGALILKVCDPARSFYFTNAFHHRILHVYQN